MMNIEQLRTRYLELVNRELPSLANFYVLLPSWVNRPELVSFSYVSLSTPIGK